MPHYPTPPYRIIVAGYPDKPYKCYVFSDNYMFASYDLAPQASYNQEPLASPDRKEFTKLIALEGHQLLRETAARNYLMDLMDNHPEEVNPDTVKLILSYI